jgi:hypothetical protein
MPDFCSRRRVSNWRCRSPKAAIALLGATGLVLLALIVSGGVGSALVGWSLGVFVVAALGGFYLASHHLKKRLPPKGVVVLHALLAVTGFGILLAAYLNV